MDDGKLEGGLSTLSDKIEPHSLSALQDYNELVVQGTFQPLVISQDGQNFKCVFQAPVNFISNILNEHQIQTLKAGFTEVCSSKRQAKQAVATAVIAVVGKDFLKKKKNGSEKQVHLSPLLALNNLKTQNLSVKYEISEPSYPGDVFRGKLEIEADTYTQTCDYSCPFNYARHKLASRLLKAASCKHSSARALYEQLAKSQPYYKGSKLPGIENKKFELKGNADSNSIVEEKSVANNFRVYGQSICGFLNTEGGSLFIGVHDSGTIQGVRIKSVDEFKLRILNSLRDKFEPEISNDIEIFFHQLQTPPMKRQIPPRSEVVDEYVRYLETELKALQDYVQNLPSNQVDGIFIIEIRCVIPTKSHPPYMYDGRAYIRTDGATCAMSYQQLQDRIIEHYSNLKSK